MALRALRTPAGNSASTSASCRRGDRRWNGHGRSLLKQARQPRRPHRVPDFFDCDLTGKAVSRKLLKHEFFYNYERPHSALDYLAPNEYVVAQEVAWPQCHVY